MQFSDDILSGFYFFAALQGIVLSIALMLGDVKLRHANRWLALLMFSISIFLFRKISHLSGFLFHYPQLLGVYPIVFIWGPLLYFYARSLVSNSKQHQKRDAWHFAPVIMMLIAYMPIYLLSDYEKIQLINAYYQNTFSSHEHLRQVAYIGLSGPLLGWLHLACYCWVILRSLHRHAAAMLNEFSAVELVNLAWLRKITALCLITALAATSGYTYALMNNYPLLNAFTRHIELAATLLLFLAGYMSLKQPTIFHSPAANTLHKNSARPTSANSSDTRPIPKYEKSSLTEGAANSYKKAVLALVANQKLYLNNDLTLTKLAEIADIPHRHLSQVINAKLGMSFYDFINQYRVQAAKELLADPKKAQLPVVDIAIACGFNNKNSFYKAFKALTGMTPSTYRREHNTHQ